jgi:RNA polymerase sigma-70 factor (sigma-E family)
MMDILVFPQSCGGFWGGVTECGLGSAKSWPNAVRRCGHRHGSGIRVGGEPVNGQSAEAVLDSPPAEPVLEAPPVGVFDARADAALNGQADSALNGKAAGSGLEATTADHAITDSETTDTVVTEGALAAPATDAAPDDDVTAADVATDEEPVVALGDMPTLSYPAVDAETGEGHDDVGTKFADDGEPPDEVARPTSVTETLTATALVPEVRPAPATWNADRVVTELYLGQYKSLVRLAVLLVHDVPTAEEVVQDAFEAMHYAQRRLRDSEKALSYLRQAVVNRSRSVLRHRTVVDKNAPKPAPDEPSAEHAAMALIERSAVIEALRTLPDRQREAIVLRYYADLSEADIAATMGISKGAVKSHTARAMAALKSILEQETA